MLGRTISHYRIVSQLGSGGMGVVYGAEDVRLGRPVALKFVHDELSRDRQAVDRFQFEARAASALNHPNICTIHDIGEDEGRPFIVMELMKGQTLRDRLATGSLRIHHIVDIGIQVADALDAAHAQGIIHRDIKPANIFLIDRGQAKVLDFGLAKLLPRQASRSSMGTLPASEQLTVVALTMGTVAYMSPEQVAGEELDGRTDLFSVGVVLYECATGHRPFTGNTSAVILAAILNRAPVAPVVFNPDLPLRLQEIINNCLEKDRELRYQTAADLRADLKRARRDLESGHSGAIRAVVAPQVELPDRVEAGVAGAAVPSVRLEGAIIAAAPPPATVAVSRSGRARRLILASGVVVLALLAGSSYWLWPRAPAPPQGTAVPSVPPAAGEETPAPPGTGSVEPPSRATAGAPTRPADQPAKTAPTWPRGSSAPPALPQSPPPAARGSAQPLPQPLPPARGGDDPARSGTSGEKPLPAQALPPAAVPVVVAPPPPTAPPREATPPPVTVPVERKDRENASPTPPTVEDDDAAIRRLVATYARAIETKNLPLFRSVKPNLSREEERRIAEGFRAVSSQQVSVTILSIDRRGSEASVRLARRDTIDAGGRRQTSESEQTMTVARAGGGWIIVEIRR